MLITDRGNCGTVQLKPETYINPGDKGLLTRILLIYLNFQPLEVVSRYREPQPQVVENYSYLFNLRPNICKS